MEQHLRFHERIEIRIILIMQEILKFIQALLRNQKNCVIKKRKD